MSNQKYIDIKELHILLCQWYQYKNFDPNNIKIDKKSYKNILITTLDMWRSKIWNL